MNGIKKLVQGVHIQNTAKAIFNALAGTLKALP
jgi:hypothetical protein